MGHVGLCHESQPLERGVGSRDVAPGRPGREAQVLAGRQVVVTEGVVPDERETPAVGPSIDRQILAEHLDLAAMHRQQSGKHAQEGGLPRSVRTGQQHDLSSRHVEVDAGEGGKAAEQAHDGAQTDEGNHSPTGLRDPADRGLRNARVYGRAVDQSQPARRSEFWDCDP